MRIGTHIESVFSTQMVTAANQLLAKTLTIHKIHQKSNDTKCDSEETTIEEMILPRVKVSRTMLSKNMAH